MPLYEPALWIAFILLQLMLMLGAVFLTRLVLQQHKRLNSARLQIRTGVYKEQVRIRTANSVLATLLNWTILGIIPKTWRLPFNIGHQVVKHFR